MAEQKLNAPARAQHEIRRSPAGVRKVTEYQDPGYTIVGNHLAQHRSLSGLAIGLAAHIQSLPEPATREHHTPAAALLANLRRDDPRLLLSVRDIHRLTPPIAAWLECGASPDAVRRALATGLPPTLRHPAALLAHRLTELLPPPLPAASPAAPTRARPAPLQTCDGCDRAFRAPAPGRCRDCRHPAAVEEGAAAEQRAAS
ncbi:helix-turn-helix domain-containing protein [Streptomyces sp. NPDC015125]|uniref:helix-turn-helix domain-containing protein n=1 Tax=Streptomyces sp. NPDC015125 TaxID=3364938 RepID=UPI0036F9F9AA